MRSGPALVMSAAAVGLAVLVWPAPREDAPGDAIRVVRGGAPTSPADAGIKDDLVAVAASGSKPTGTARPARYAWEAEAAGDDDAPGDPEIWATPARFASPE